MSFLIFHFAFYPILMENALPILAYKDQIIQTVSENRATVVIGATGSGKTTQLPQFLYEAGFANHGLIGITQPRRVATVSVAKRVAQEMKFEVGKEVGYSIRFEDRSSSSTKLLFFTDGCLLREFLKDPFLTRFSVIILDEAHERSLNTDILFGLLKNLLSARKNNLKIIITSATLDSEKFSKFFFCCPKIEVPGRQFFVEIFHSTETPSNYLNSAIQTTIDIHINQPKGDILVFLTGKEEIDKGIRMIEERIIHHSMKDSMDVILLPLHASLPPEFQSRIFHPSPPDCRRIILCTNVAETSLTVNNVVYVVDCGKVKQKLYDPETGIDTLSVVSISKVQAIQRAGRAGRVCKGKCYRLYPFTSFQNEFADCTLPEIQRVSLVTAVLHLKSLRFADVDILSFDFFDPPSFSSLEDSLKQLFILDAIDEDGKITALGMKMAELPLEPSLAKSLLVSKKLNCLNDCIIISSMLSSHSSSFLPSYSQMKEAKRKRRLVERSRGGEESGEENEFEKERSRHMDREKKKGREGKRRRGGREKEEREERRRESKREKERKKHSKLFVSTKDEREEEKEQGMIISSDKNMHNFPHNFITEMNSIPDGNGYGDFIFFLQIFKSWKRNGMKKEWCKENGIEFKTMRFADDVSNQLTSAMERNKNNFRIEKISKISELHVSENRESRKRQKFNNDDDDGGDVYENDDNDDVSDIPLHGFDFKRFRTRIKNGRGRRDDDMADDVANVSDFNALRYSLFSGFCNHLCQRMRKYNGYKTIQAKSKLIEMHPSGCPLQVDEEGLLPEWIFFHSLVFTSRGFMKYVCVAEGEWIAPFLSKFESMDVSRLSGKSKNTSMNHTIQEHRSLKKEMIERKEEEEERKEEKEIEKEKEKKMKEAKERFLARKQSKQMK